MSTTVLCVMGRGRGGSTILANVLGAYEGFVSAGEVRVLWDPIVLHRGECGCGQAVDACEVWSRVLEQLGDVDVERAAALQREVVTERNLPRLLRTDPLRVHGWPALADYAALMGDVYRVIAGIAGARVVVDSSKRPSYAAFLRVVPGIEPYFLQLVRDPRASAYSWRTRRYSSAVPGEEVKRRGSLDATLRWDVLNLGAEAVRRRAEPGHARRLAFEAFTAAPRAIADSLVAFCGEPVEGSPFVDERTAELGVGHAVAGNPSRYSAGRVEIHDSEEWLSLQRPSDRWIATAVSLPFLRRYGYPVRPGT